MMKLYYAAASPYARKVRVVAAERGLTDQIEVINASGRDGAFQSINPFARVPALKLEDGTVLFDSPVICEYLDALKGAQLFPASGPKKWQALLGQAAGDGIMDWAVPRRQEGLRPANEQSPDFIARATANMRRAVDYLETIADKLDGVDIGTLTIACALGYIDFRFPDDKWRDGHPKLAAWYERISQRPSMTSTIPAA